MSLGTGTILSPIAYSGSTSVTLAGLAGTQSLNSFLYEISRFGLATESSLPGSLSSDHRVQLAENQVDRRLGGSGLTMTTSDEILAWRRETGHLNPAQRELLLANEPDVVANIRTQFRDPHISATLISLYRAGYLIQEGDRFHVRPIREWRDGLEVIEILDAHAEISPYDILDFIHAIDWGPLDPYGEKGINASFRCLGDFTRHEQRGLKTLTAQKKGVLAHTFTDRGMTFSHHVSFWGRFGTGPFILDKDLLNHAAELAAHTTPLLIGRLIVEHEVARRMANRSTCFATLPTASSAMIYAPIESLFGLSEARIKEMTVAEYEAVQRRITSEIWTKCWLEPRLPETLGSSIIEDAPVFSRAQRVTESIDPDETVSINLAKPIRTLRKELVILDYLFIEKAPSLQAMRISKFISALTQALPNLRDPENTSRSLEGAEELKLYWDTLMVWIRELHQILQSMEPIGTPPTNIMAQGDFGVFKALLEMRCSPVATNLGEERTREDMALIAETGNLWEEKMPGTWFGRF